MGYGFDLERWASMWHLVNYYEYLKEHLGGLPIEEVFWTGDYAGYTTFRPAYVVET